MFLTALNLPNSHGSVFPLDYAVEPQSLCLTHCDSHRVRKDAMHSSHIRTHVEVVLIHSNLEPAFL